MYRMNNKFAIGCLVQWYEIEIIEEYIDSLKQSLDNIENKENVIVDLYFNISTALEKIDESKIELFDLIRRFKKIGNSLKQEGMDLNVQTLGGNMLNERDIIYTIADYRREFNEKYCEKVDVLIWGESDSLLPKQTFEILDSLHSEVNLNTPKYITTFSICKMWDESWNVLEHPEFTDKPFIENDYDNWWSLKYTMNIDEMNKFNNKVEELDIITLDSFKFNGCGLVISSDIIKSGVNIPKSVFFVHEDTAFQNIMIKLFNNTIPQYVIKNVLIVHNRNHPKKRMYIKGEIDGGTMNEKRRSNDWYTDANRMSEFNAYNFLKQNKLFKWGDVFNEE